MAQKEQILAKGLRFFEKHSSAPDFVVGTLVITPNDIVTMCKEQAEHLTDYNGTKQLRLQILTSKAGQMYATVDTWKKGDAPSKAKTETTTAGNNVSNAADDLPF